MELRSFDNRIVFFDKQKISIEEILSSKNTRFHLGSDHLSFIYTLDPMQLNFRNNVYFVPERSVIKAHPDSDAFLELQKGSPVYVIGFHRDEKSYLDALNKNLFLNSAENKEKDEWDAVQTQDVDFILPTEKNSEHIIRLENRVLIAPPNSRRDPNSNIGWNLMYARGSRALGVASDILFSVRPNEVSHSHRIIEEFYIALSGSILLDMAGTELSLGPKQILLAEPGENHSIRSVTQVPYAGIVLNLPSVPGDRIFA